MTLLSGFNHTSYRYPSYDITKSVFLFCIIQICLFSLFASSFHGNEAMADITVDLKQPLKRSDPIDITITSDLTTLKYLYISGDTLNPCVTPVQSSDITSSSKRIQLPLVLSDNDDTPTNMSVYHVNSIWNQIDDASTCAFVSVKIRIYDDLNAQVYDSDETIGHIPIDSVVTTCSDEDPRYECFTPVFVPVPDLFRATIGGSRAVLTLLGQGYANIDQELVIAQSDQYSYNLYDIAITFIHALGTTAPQLQARLTFMVSTSQSGPFLECPMQLVDVMHAGAQFGYVTNYMSLINQCRQQLSTIPEMIPGPSYTMHWSLKLQLIRPNVSDADHVDYFRPEIESERKFVVKFAPAIESGAVSITIPSISYIPFQSQSSPLVLNWDEFFITFKRKVISSQYKDTFDCPVYLIFMARNDDLTQVYFDAVAGIVPEGLKPSPISSSMYTYIRFIELSLQSSDIPSYPTIDSKYFLNQLLQARQTFVSANYLSPNAPLYLTMDSVTCLKIDRVANVASLYYNNFSNPFDGSKLWVTVPTTQYIGKAVIQVDPSTSDVSFKILNVNTVPSVTYTVTGTFSGKLKYKATQATSWSAEWETFTLNIIENARITNSVVGYDGSQVYPTDQLVELINTRLGYTHVAYQFQDVIYTARAGLDPDILDQVVVSDPISICPSTYLGPNCDQDQTCSSVYTAHNSCSQHGYIQYIGGICDQICTCYDGWEGNTCNQPTQCSQIAMDDFDSCSQHGYISYDENTHRCSDTCICTERFTGDRCQYYTDCQLLADNLDCPFNSIPHTYYNTAVGYCESSCVCPDTNNLCGGHGYLKFEDNQCDNQCTCDHGFSGLKCVIESVCLKETEALDYCSYHGLVQVDPKTGLCQDWCTCDSVNANSMYDTTWFGDTCAKSSNCEGSPKPECPMNSFIDHTASLTAQVECDATNTCQCISEYGGTDCESCNITCYNSGQLSDYAHCHTSLVWTAPCDCQAGYAGRYCQYASYDFSFTFDDYDLPSWLTAPIQSYGTAPSSQMKLFEADVSNQILQFLDLSHTVTNTVDTNNIDIYNQDIYDRLTIIYDSSFIYPQTCLSSTIPNPQLIHTTLSLTLRLHFGDSLQSASNQMINVKNTINTNVNIIEGMIREILQHHNIKKVTETDNGLLCLRHCGQEYIDLDRCSGHGQVIPDMTQVDNIICPTVCTCDFGWSGDTCDRVCGEQYDELNKCNGHGLVLQSPDEDDSDILICNATCTCDTANGWVGDDCSLNTSCSYASSTIQCPQGQLIRTYTDSLTGACIAYCACESPSHSPTSPDCNGHGSFTAPLEQSSPCPTDIDDYGTEIQCHCDDGWYGPHCEHNVHCSDSIDLLDQCNGVGTVHYNTQTKQCDAQCTCYDTNLWSGDTCQQSALCEETSITLKCAPYGYVKMTQLQGECDKSCSCYYGFTGPLCATCNIKCSRYGVFNEKSRCQTDLPTIMPCSCQMNALGRYCQYYEVTSAITIRNRSLPRWLVTSIKEKAISNKMTTHFIQSLVDSFNVLFNFNKDNILTNTVDIDHTGIYNKDIVDRISISVSNMSVNYQTCTDSSQPDAETIHIPSSLSFKVSVRVGSSLSSVSTEANAIYARWNNINSTTNLVTILSAVFQEHNIPYIGTKDDISAICAYNDNSDVEIVPEEPIFEDETNENTENENESNSSLHRDTTIITITLFFMLFFFTCLF